MGVKISRIFYLFSRASNLMEMFIYDFKTAKWDTDFKHDRPISASPYTLQTVYHEVPFVLHRQMAGEE